MTDLRKTLSFTAQQALKRASPEAYYLGWNAGHNVAIWRVVEIAAEDDMTPETMINRLWEILDEDDDYDPAKDA